MACSIRYVLAMHTQGKDSCFKDIFRLAIAIGPFLVGSRTQGMMWSRGTCVLCMTCYPIRKTKPQSCSRSTSLQQTDVTSGKLFKYTTFRPSRNYLHLKVSTVLTHSQNGSLLSQMPLSHSAIPKIVIFEREKRLPAPSIHSVFPRVAISKIIQLGTSSMSMLIHLDILDRGAVPAWLSEESYYSLPLCHLSQGYRLLPVFAVLQSTTFCKVYARVLLIKKITFRFCWANQHRMCRAPCQEEFIPKQINGAEKAAYAA